MSTGLKTVRERLGLTQAQIAEKAQITVMSYSRYETGKRDPRIQTAIRIAHALGVTVEELFPITNGSRDARRV